MITKRILSGLIAGLTLVYLFVYAASQQYVIAFLSVVIGFVWFRLQDDQEQSLLALFFVFFLGLALLGTFTETPTPVLMLCVCVDLAVWDLSRFRARVSRARNGEIDPVLERRHLKRLFVPIGVGFVIAMLPSIFRISVNFVVFSVLILLVMLVLRASVLYLRQPQA
jgi:hypothetical protein